MLQIVVETIVVVGKEKSFNNLRVRVRKKRLWNRSHNFLHASIDWVITCIIGVIAYPLLAKRKECSIKEEIREFYSINDVVFGNEFF